MDGDAEDTKSPWDSFSMDFADDDDEDSLDPCPEAELEGSDAIKDALDDIFCVTKQHVLLLVKRLDGSLRNEANNLRAERNALAMENAYLNSLLNSAAPITPRAAPLPVAWSEKAAGAPGAVGQCRAGCDTWPDVETAVSAQVLAGPATWEALDVPAAWADHCSPLILLDEPFGNASDEPGYAPVETGATVAEPACRSSTRATPYPRIHCEHVHTIEQARESDTDTAYLGSESDPAGPGTIPLWTSMKSSSRDYVHAIEQAKGLDNDAVDLGRGSDENARQQLPASTYPFWTCMKSSISRVGYSCLGEVRQDEACVVSEESTEELSSWSFGLPSNANVRSSDMVIHGNLKCDHQPVWPEQPAWPGRDKVIHGNLKCDHQPVWPGQLVWPGRDKTCLAI